MALREFNEATFDAALAEGKPVLVDFWATWCGPCRMVGPFIEQIANEFEGKAIVGKVDVDAVPELAARFGIATIPSILVFSDGELVEKAVGARPKAAFADMLAKYIKE